jgi:hypothetical protein
MPFQLCCRRTRVTEAPRVTSFGPTHQQCCLEGIQHSHVPVPSTAATGEAPCQGLPPLHLWEQGKICACRKIYARWSLGYSKCLLCSVGRAFLRARSRVPTPQEAKTLTGLPPKLAPGWLSTKISLKANVEV